MEYAHTTISSKATIRYNVKLHVTDKPQDTLLFINEMGRPGCVSLVSSLVIGKVRKEREMLGHNSSSERRQCLGNAPYITRGKNDY